MCALFHFAGVLLLMWSCSDAQRDPGSKQRLRVRVRATSDSIVLQFVRPVADMKLQGYILGYGGGNLIDKQFILLPEDGQTYQTELDAEPKYLVAVQPVPSSHVDKQCTGKVDLDEPLHLVMKGSVSPTAVLLSWGKSLKTQPDGDMLDDCLEDGFYTIRYRERNRKWNYQTCPTSDTVIDNLKPNTPYEFTVRANRDDRMTGGDDRTTGRDGRMTGGDGRGDHTTGRGDHATGRDGRMTGADGRGDHTTGRDDSMAWNDDRTAGRWSNTVLHNTNMAEKGLHNKPYKVRNPLAKPLNPVGPRALFPPRPALHNRTRLSPQFKTLGFPGSSRTSFGRGNSLRNDSYRRANAIPAFLDVLSPKASTTTTTPTPTTTTTTATITTTTTTTTTPTTSTTSTSTTTQPAARIARPLLPHSELALRGQINNKLSSNATDKRYSTSAVSQSQDVSSPLRPALGGGQANNNNNNNWGNDDLITTTTTVSSRGGNRRTLVPLLPPQPPLAGPLGRLRPLGGGSLRPLGEPPLRPIGGALRPIGGALRPMGGALRPMGGPLRPSVPALTKTTMSGGGAREHMKQGTDMRPSTGHRQQQHHRGLALPKAAVWNPGLSGSPSRSTMNKRRPNLVGKPGEMDKLNRMKLTDKLSVLNPHFSAVTAKPDRRLRKPTTTTTTTTTTTAPVENVTPFEHWEESDKFSSQPSSEVDAMGKKRFVAPHVMYKIDKRPDEPCSITSSLNYFPEDPAPEADVTAPPRAPPSNLTVVTVEGCPSFVILDWEKRDNDTTEYEVVSTAKGPDGEQVSVLTTNQTHTAVENLKPDNSYEFKVTPKNELGTGPASDPVSFSTESADPRVSENVSGKDAIWTAFPFQTDGQSECRGKQYVKRTWYRKFVGVQICNSLRYNIYLSDTLTGKFYSIGDQSGFGEDHCQFVDSFLDGKTGRQLRADQLPLTKGFYRAIRQQPVMFGQIGGRTHISYVSWYECGTPIPGKW